MGEDPSFDDKSSVRSARTARSVQSSSSSAGLKSKKGISTAAGAGEFEYADYVSVQLSRSWTRRYVVIRKASLYFYEDKKSFESRPRDALNKRPVELAGYSLRVQSPSKEEEYGPVSLVLTPMSEDDLRKSLELRCDSIAEARRWIAALGSSLALPVYH